MTLGDPAVTVSDPVPWRGGGVRGWSVSSLFRSRARATPDDPAFVRVHRAGEQIVTWRELEADVDRMMAWLAERGVRREDRVASLMSPSVDAVVLELALYCAGAISVSIYQTSAIEQIADTSVMAQARLIIADSAEQLERAASAAEQVPNLTPVRFPTRNELEALEPRVVPDEDRNAPETVACIVFTSGTTGKSKGVVHTHGTLLHAAVTGRPRPYEPSAEPERIVWHLPMAHVVGKIRSSLLPLVMNLVNYVPVDGLDAAEILPRVRPTYVVEPPRFWAKSAERAEASLSSERSAEYRSLYERSTRVIPQIWSGETLAASDQEALESARRTVFADMLKAIGYDAIRYAYISSAAIPESLVRKWHTWGVNLQVTYGLTESGGRITEQSGEFPAPDTIGAVVNEAGWAAKLAEDGELLVRGPSMSPEYWQNPEANAEAFDDGWFKTGDLAVLTDDLQYRLVGRKKELLITEGGKSISPQLIESHFHNSAVIHRLIAVGDGRKYITALVEPSEFSGSEDALRDAVNAEIERVNQKLSRVEQLKYFRILPVPLSEAEGHLTMNGKLRRKRVEEDFGRLIGEMYL